MANDIEALRGHLFDTLAQLRDKDKPMEIDRAKAVADVGRVLIDSAKAEIEFLKVTGLKGSTGFIAGLVMAPQKPQLGSGRPTQDVAPGAKRRCPECQQTSKTDPCSHCGKTIFGGESLS